MLSHPAWNAAKILDLWTANVCWHVNLSVLNITQSHPSQLVFCISVAGCCCFHMLPTVFNMCGCVQVFAAAGESLEILLTSSYKWADFLSNVHTMLHTSAVWTRRDPNQGPHNISYRLTHKNNLLTSKNKRKPAGCNIHNKTNRVKIESKVSADFAVEDFSPLCQIWPIRSSKQATSLS